MSADASTDAGFAKLADFFTQAKRAVGHTTGYLHAGDVWWRCGQYEPAHHRLHLWEDDQGVIGAAWILSENDLEIHLRPGLNDAQFAELAQEMLEWAQEVCAKEVISSCAMDDFRMIAAFEQSGFAQNEFELLTYLHDLSTPLPKLEVPVGFEFRHVKDSEFAERVSVHRDAWNPSKFTPERYARVRSQLGFVPELDLVAVADDGSFAAYCIIWLCDGVGQFEPVGTRNAFRQRGLARAVIHEGFRRLQLLGAHTAAVCSLLHNQVFYEACGFKVVNRIIGFHKKL